MEQVREAPLPAARACVAWIAYTPTSGRLGQ